MLSTTKTFLEKLNEERITDPNQGLKRLRTLGLTEFAQVTNEMEQGRWEQVNYVPQKTDEKVQQAFTGTSGKTLLTQSIDFVRYFYCQVLTHFLPVSPNTLKDLRIVDYGCGWGRLLRLMPYYFSYEKILGLDPWDVALTECKKSGILSPTRIVQRDAGDLSGETFDAGYAFSVFTHLPEGLAKKVLSNLNSCFSENGLFTMTIRPPEYWTFRVGSAKDDMQKRRFEKAYSEHFDKGFAFLPHGGPNGEFFGDSSMTIDWFESNIKKWKIIDIDRSLKDSLQTYLTMVKKEN